jgi:hypothetical protein
MSKFGRLVAEQVGLVVLHKHVVVGQAVLLTWK